MCRTIYDLSDTVMLLHKCTRRQAMEYLHSDKSEQDFFSDVGLVGYVSYPCDDLEKDINNL